MSARLRRLIEAHQGPALRRALSILRDEAEALDALQEACLSLHRHLDGLSDEDVGPWLRRVVSNAAIDRLRRREREPEARGALLEPDGRARDPAQMALDRERHEALSAALDDLSLRQREVLLARVVDGERFTSLAPRLGMSEGTAKVHLRRALARMKQRLTGGA